MKETVLLTGGAGFIGSHIAVELLQRDYNVVIADDLSNARPDVPERIEKITGRAPVFYRMDVSDRQALDRVFDVARRLSGLSDDDVEELAEGFGNAPSEDSTSG